MNFLADENIETEVVDLLRGSGYKVDYVLEMSPGINDKEIIQQANKSDAILITSDKDFGELIFRQHMIHCGVILIRLYGVPSDIKANMVLNFVKNYFDKIHKSFSVVSHSNIRIRSQIN